VKSTLPIAAIASLFLSAGALLAAPARPNIMIIMADDMGFSDLGCYGGEIATPNLDALAAHGVRFKQFYNTSRCCPTRAALLTGLYPHQTGIGHMMTDDGFDAYRGNLNRKCVTIAEALKPAGYKNYHVGKWHVTRHIAPDGPKFNWPLQRGFDRCYATITGAGSFWDPTTLVRDNTMISAFADPAYQPTTYYYTDAISDHAVRYVSEHGRDHKDRPFFMYVAFTAAHWPMHARPEEIAKYKGKYDGGYEPIRKARFAKSVELGLIDPKQPMTPAAKDWDEIADKKWEAAGMEVYAAMIDRMDQGIGNIIAELKRTGQFDNTLILFLQDNGACAELQGRTPTKDHPNIERPDKPTFPAMKPEALQILSVYPLQTRDGFPVRMGSKVMPGPADTYIAYGKGWANVSNTPFREYKHWSHEGGISSPLVAHWPKGVAAEQRGKLYAEPGHLIDLMATCVDLAGAVYPIRFADEPIEPMEGVSLRPAFEGKSLERGKPLFWEHEGNKAIRDGKWKLVAMNTKSWELYNVDADRVESRDLASAEPERVKTMAAQWDGWAKRVGVRPFPLAKKIEK
jgi:arylsulfatase